MQAVFPYACIMPGVGRRTETSKLQRVDVHAHTKARKGAIQALPCAGTSQQDA